MNTLIVFAAVIIAASASYIPHQHVDVAQDTLGNYKFNINTLGFTRSEHALSNGNLAGTYSYVAPDGVIRTVQYTSGIGGFQVVGDHLPAAVQYTPEVAVARAAHFAKLGAAYF